MHFSSKRPCREIAFWAYISNRIFLAVGSLSWLPPFHQTNTTLFVWLLRPVVTCLVSASLPLYFSRPPRLLPQLLVTYSVRNFPRIATSSVQELFGKSCETISFHLLSQKSGGFSHSSNFWYDVLLLLINIVPLFAHISPISVVLNQNGQFDGAEPPCSSTKEM